MSRRRFLAGSAALAAFRPAPSRARSADGPLEKKKALISITLDLEMSRNFPTWDQTHWDYEKGNLDSGTKSYALQAARLVKEKGGLIHFFAVGRVFEQESVEWLEEIVKSGHPVGNHTYDHVNVKAREPKDLQFRFQRAPWLIHGKKPLEVIAENIQLTTLALKARLGIDPEGFRTPGGFTNGLEDRVDVQRLLLDQGFSWVSSQYPAHPTGAPGEEPSAETLQGILKAQELAQPFEYATGLVEVPMSPVSDVTAFRSGRWKLESFLKAVESALDWAIERRAVFDFLGHPSCLLITDPELRTFNLICDRVRKAGDGAAVVGLHDIARSTRRKTP
jgi:peptidoglycan/xylan/chitin deacetylase (PgdA/CDA1 family)